MNKYRRERLIEIARSLQNLRTGKNLHFSFILKNNQLLCYATNDYTRLHPYHRYGKYLPTRNANSKDYTSGRHSEINALSLFINKFGTSDVSGLTLFNVRLGREGETMIAAPCLNCTRTIISPLNWKNVLWTC